MKDIIIVKFGGSSLADSRQISKVKAIIKTDDRRRFIIPSAPGKRHGQDHKVTDLLYMCYQLASHGLNFDEVYSIIEKRFQDICKELGLDIDITQLLTDIKIEITQGASVDYCASRGEYLNAIILSNYLGFEFIDATELILFDYNGELNMNSSKEKIESTLSKMPNGVIPGFYGAKPNGEIKTFSRGGSDITGSIIAKGVDAMLYENWTDVSGFLMADPRIVKNPKPIEKVTFKELRELSYMGAPVLHEESIFPIRNTGIPINIKNTNSPEDPGTIITDDLSSINYQNPITGIAGKKDFIVLSIEKTLMTLEKGFLRKLMSVFETNDISIEHMPSSIDSISIVVASSQIHTKLQKIIEEIKIYCNPDSITCYRDMALITVVGKGMIQTKGTSAKIFTALANNGVNIRMITQGSSELNIIVGIKNKDFEKAISSIYEAFEN